MSNKDSNKDSNTPDESYLPLKSKSKIQQLQDAQENVITDLIAKIIEIPRDILPPAAFALADKVLEELDEHNHKIDCQSDKAKKAGDKDNCDRGKFQLAEDKKQANYRNSVKPNTVKASDRKHEFRRKSKNNDNLSNTRFNQNLNYGRDYTEKRYQLKFGKDPFDKDFSSESDATLGNKAIWNKSNGQVVRTANSLAREDAATQISASLATANPVRSLPVKKNNNIKTEILNIKKAIENGQGKGQASTIASIFAIVTGSFAILALLAIMVPASFITVALNWIQTITSMFTQVKSVTTTYLAMTDAFLALFGYKNASGEIKQTINSIAYGIFGEKNYKEAVAAFATGILNLTSMAKLLEKIQSMKNGSDNKIDNLAMQLGSANNLLKESGVIPPDSPWASASADIDKFVAAQDKLDGDTDIADNIGKLTEEIKTNKEIDEEIKVEKELADKALKLKVDSINNLGKLGENLKPEAEKAIDAASKF
jgi:hypothetical protein